MRRKISISATIILLLLTGVFAQDYYFDVFYVKCHLQGSDVSRNTIEANLVALEPIEEVTLELPENFADIRVEDVGGRELETTVVDNQLTIHFSSLDAGKSTFFRINYFTDESVSFINSKNLFSYVFSPTVRIKDFQLTVYLPKKATIVTQNEIPLITPGGEISSDGERITVKYRKSLEQDQQFSSMITYKLDRNHFQYLLFILGLILGGLLVWLFFSKKNKKKIRKKTQEMLPEDEQLIYDLVFEKEGIFQTEIIQKTGFSKSKVSKLLRNLEKKKLIRKEPYRKTNKLFVK